MDFAYTDEQQAIIDLARKMLRDQATHERERELERAGGPRFDRALWGEMAAAGLLGIAVPEALGGGGLGFLEVAAIVEEIGRTTAPVPFLETAVLGALPLAEFGSAAQQRSWLPRVADGTAVLTAALVEPEGAGARPLTTARGNGAGWTLHGTKTCVPAGEIADLVLIPATTERGAVAILLVEPSAPGVRVEPLDTTSGQPEARLVLDDVRVGADAVLGEPAGGEAIVAWIDLRATAALCSLAVGVCAEALALTAEYTKSRKQFDQPIATFQAVGHREADAYVDTEAVRLTAWQAAWRIAAGKPAAAEVAVAKYWAAEGGQRVVHAAQHLHGGMGVDRDYPLHRFFLYARQLELTLGGATHQLLKLGRMMADEPA